MTTAIYRDTGVRFKATYKDINDNLANPNNPQIIIERPDGSTEITDTPSGPISTGKYEYDFTFDQTHPTGNYQIQWYGELGGLPMTEIDEIYVLAKDIESTER